MCETLGNVLFQVAQRSRDEQEILHNKVQDMIKCNVILSKVTRRKQQHREALLGTIDMDANLLLSKHVNICHQEFYLETRY